MTARGQPAEDAQIAALTQRVTGLEQAITSIGKQIEGLSTTFSERSRTPWGVLISAAGVMIVLTAYGGSLALAPIVQAVERNQSDVTTIIAGLVPRGEHEERWRSLEREDETLQTQIDKIDGQFGGTWSIRDGLETINERLDRYDARLAEIEAGGK